MTHAAWVMHVRIKFMKLWNMAFLTVVNLKTQNVTKNETFVYCSVQVCNQVFAAGCNQNVN